MPLQLVLTTLIGVDALREAVGRPTLDTSDPGYVPDATLEEIIQRHHDNAYETVLAAAGDRARAGDAVAPLRLYERVEITASADDHVAPLWSAAAPEGYFPWPVRMTDADGLDYGLDVRIRAAVNTAFWPVYGYDVVGRRVHVALAKPESSYPAGLVLYAHFAPEDVVAAEGADRGVIAAVNEAIISEARQTVAAILAEGRRLDMTGRTA